MADILISFRHGDCDLCLTNDGVLMVRCFHPAQPATIAMEIPADQTQPLMAAFARLEYAQKHPDAAYHPTVGKPEVPEEVLTPRARDVFDQALSQGMKRSWSLGR